MKNHFPFFALCLLTLFMMLSAFELLPPQDNVWVVPDNFAKLQNPVTSDKSSIEAGKALYAQHCKSCHGKEGLGDGSKAAQLETPCGDFTDENFTSQSDGVLFYKTKEGRGDMPGFTKKIPDDRDIWHLVNYIRTLE